MKLRDVPADMIAAADKADHQTVWLKDNKEVFIFITWCPDTMKRAQKALDDAGVLCDLTIGHVPPQKRLDEWRFIVREPSGVRCHQLISDGEHVATVEEGDGMFTVYMAFGESPGVSTTLVAAKHLAERTFAAGQQERLD